MSIEVVDNDLIADLKRRYLAAMHAVQTGVALSIERGSKESTPKHLRLGVNSAMIDSSAMAKLLIEKGIVSETEYLEMLVKVAEEEQVSYEARLGVKLA